MHASQKPSRRNQVYDLKGLTYRSPIGYMAALGMLRVLTQDRGIGVRLGWRNGHAVIDGIEPDSAIDELAANMDGRGQDPEFSWADTPKKVTPEVYRGACDRFKEDRRALSFMAGWATDAVLRDGFVSVGRMDMTSGRQQLLRDLRNLATRVTRSHFITALTGGDYEEQSSFGLDPVAVRTHAHEPRTPTASSPPGKRGLIWLAFESVPLHPIFPVASNRTMTAGWRRAKSTGYAYVWPVWTGFLTLDEVALLRMMPVDRLSERPEFSEIWSSQLEKSGEYPCLLPARRER
jgi:CRISPR-associated endonuclease/helicase Cas3